MTASDRDSGLLHHTRERLALCKGRLLSGVLALLEEAGITFSFASDRDYRPTCVGADLEAKILKVRAIPQLKAWLGHAHKQGAL